MRPCISAGSVVIAAMMVGASASAAPSTSASQPSRDLVKAIAHGDCDSAVHLANQGMRADDAQTIFLIGRMLAQGVCIEPDVAAATPYFSHAAAQGLSAAEVEYGLQVGLGAGVEQSYERAGELCQKGGLERQGSDSSLYSLGYLCTVRGLASRRVRQSVPHGAFIPGSRAALLSFNPSSGVMQIRSTPRVASVPDTTTGTFVQRPLIDAQAAIDKAWREAMGAVPKPDASRLENRGVELNLDLDITIEGSAASGPGAHLLPNSALMPSDLRPQPAAASPFGR